MGTWKATADLQIYTQMFFACAVRPTSSLLCQSNAKLFTFILYDDVSILVKGVTVSHPWNHRIEKWFDKCENDVNCLIWPLQSLYLNSFWEILNPSDKQILYVHQSTPREYLDYFWFGNKGIKLMLIQQKCLFCFYFILAQHAWNTNVSLINAYWI